MQKELDIRVFGVNLDTLRNQSPKMAPVAQKKVAQKGSELIPTLKDKSTNKVPHKKRQI